MRDSHATPVTLTRRELYDLVWETPLHKLAPLYGLSDVGLAKICQRHQVPFPFRGYWAKLRNGHPVSKTPLSPLDDPALRTVQLYKRGSAGPDQPPRQEVQPEEAPEPPKEERIEVSDRLIDPHP